LYAAKERNHTRGEVFEAFWLVNSMTSLNNFLRLGWLSQPWLQFRDKELANCIDT